MYLFLDEQNFWLENIFDILYLWIIFKKSNYMGNALSMHIHPLKVLARELFYNNFSK